MAKKKKKAPAKKPAANKTKARTAKAAKTRKPARKVAKAKASKAKKRPAKAAKRPVAKKAAKKAAAKTPAKKAAPARKSRDVQGEGNYSASRRFRKAETSFVARNKSGIPELGKEAEAALEGPEGDGLRAAEAEASSRRMSDTSDAS